MTLIWILLGIILGIYGVNLYRKYSDNIQTWVWYEWLIVLAFGFFAIFGIAWIITNVFVIKSARGAGVGGLGALVIPILLSGYVRGLFTRGSNKKNSVEAI